MSKLVPLAAGSLSKTLVFCSSYFGILIFSKYCTNNFLDGWVFLTTSEILRQRLAALQSQPLNSLAENQFRPQLTNTRSPAATGTARSRRLLSSALPSRRGPAPSPHCLRASPAPPPRPVVLQPRAQLGSPAASPWHGGLRVPPLLPPALRPVAAKTLGRDRCLGARSGSREEPGKWKDAGCPAQPPSGTCTGPLLILPSSTGPAFSTPSR